MITNNQKKYLRSLLHHRNTVIWIGQQGLTENVSKEIQEALDHHELVKVRIRNGDRKERESIAHEICEQHQAELVQAIGNVYGIYRKNTENPIIILPA